MLSRRGLLAWTLALVVASLSAISGEAAVILGIDFGTTFIKVAFVQPGKAFDIVLNEAGKRKTNNVIAFGRDARLYGSTAAAMALRDPEHTFFRTRDLLGVAANSAEVEHLGMLDIPYELEENAATGGFKIVVDKGTPKERKLLPEELVAMILSNVQKMASDFTESKVLDCVLTVPPFFSQAQRESLLLAAEISGLRVLTLVDENVAAAVQHGVYTEFQNASHKVLLYNMGSASTKVTLLDFYGKTGKGGKTTTQIDVLAKAWDRTLGGDSIDMLMVQMIEDAFEKTHGVDPGVVRESRRALERMRSQATKVKTVLSANAEIPVSIESLHDGRDVRLHVTRKQLEDAGADLFARVTAPIERVLQESGTSVDDLHAIEIIGGGVRVPRVKEILSDYLKGKELGSHLNGDEAKAFGAVFVGANMSKAFRVRPVGLRDITTDTVQLDLVESGEPAAGAEPWAKSAVLFKSGDALDARKIVSVNVTHDFTCELSRTTPDAPERATVAFYELSGVPEAIEQFGQHGDPKVSLTIKLDLNDTVQLLQAEAIFVEKLAPPPEETPEADDSTAQATDGSEDAAAADADADAEADASDADAATEAEDEKAKGEESEKTDASEDTKDAASSKRKASRRKRKKTPTQRTHRFPLTVKRTDAGRAVRAIDDEAVAHAREVLASFDAYEEELRTKEAVKNEVESFVFEARDQVRSAEEEVDLVMSEEDKTQLFDDLEELEDWLDGEGADASLEEYRSRRKAFEKRLRKLFGRVKELDQRPAAARSARDLMSKVKSQVTKVWAKERPWITEEEKTLVLERVSIFESWLSDVESQQSSLGSLEAAAFTSADVAAHLEPLHSALEHALRRPLPTPPKSPKKASASKADAKKDDTTTEQEQQQEEEEVTTEETGKQEEEEATEDQEAEEKDEL
ncbi:Heat shock 70 kDa protein [Hondaea fermentalgiana]|uniref:Heat shock 70 kDa protein n=1 Tax=Hondaea fermentalgiana TaxID=2315210 RepID=A0A2R5H2N0_9STRA|nr:Heat shock 70 kDa protein [Hondaea fermentalgiana]|eukprot:GBG34654.1 Heat shock 70 kDa protein [Hondaea fermentalgiana]